ncbi:MAG: hypothetical protein ACTSVI_12385 [Promethearchaeota archaeon]
MDKQSTHWQLQECLIKQQKHQFKHHYTRVSWKNQNCCRKAYTIITIMN